MSTCTRTSAGREVAGVGAAEQVEDRLGLARPSRRRIDAPPTLTPARREGVQVERAGVEAAEGAAQVDDVVGGQQVVDGDRVEPGVDEAVERDRVAHALVDRAAQRPDDEVLLPADPAEVGGRVGAPAAVLVALVVARPHVGQRLVAVEA